MPVMDGFEATRRIRAMEGGEDVAICAVSASVQADTVENAQQAGCDQFLAKPIDVARLIEFISRYSASDTGVVEAKAASDNPQQATAALSHEAAQAVRIELSNLSGHAMVGDVKAARKALEIIEQRLGSNNEHIRVLRRMVEQFAMFEIVDYCIKVESELPAAKDS